MTRAILTTVTLCALSLPAARADAHCQIPCGIYDDHNRIHQMREDVTTIAKAVKQINALAKKNDAQSKQQLVRWVTNKEQHAERIIRTVSDYFLSQKIKPACKTKRAAIRAHVKDSRTFRLFDRGCSRKNFILHEPISIRSPSLRSARETSSPLT